MEETLRRTPLFELHKSRGARIVPFAGYEMPVQFEGIKAEHQAVRDKAGLFDVSHMGEIWLEGEDALAYAHWLVTNDVRGLNDGQVLYTPMCRATGMIVDDLLVYRYGTSKVLLVVNAANHDKDLKHVQENVRGKVTVTDRSYETGQLALQGPLAEDILSRVSGGKFAGLPFFRFAEGDVAGRRCLVSRTGYTGEDGYEIYCPNADVVPVASALLEVGEPMGLKPIGLGARDTLRLEAKLCLYGNDIDETTTPLEALLGWTVSFDTGDFNGRDALLRQKEQGVTRKLTGFTMEDKAIARHGYAIVAENAPASAQPIAHVASGSPSPTLGQNIGLAYLPTNVSKVGSAFGVVVRDKVMRAKVVKTPFYKRPR
ncbi:MAG: glycine cleavage system aminomethyltransferase GcvT [Deltaproteobacteria bacterium]|nr:glycine cleavage system aminomethyltransferase GcvT [Deltaproteobacteria bacterium]